MTSTGYRSCDITGPRMITWKSELLTRNFSTSKCLIRSSDQTVLVTNWILFAGTSISETTDDWSLHRWRIGATWRSRVPCTWSSVARLLVLRVLEKQRPRRIWPKPLPYSASFSTAPINWITCRWENFSKDWQGWFYSSPLQECDETTGNIFLNINFHSTFSMANQHFYCSFSGFQTLSWRFLIKLLDNWKTVSLNFF